VDREVQQQFGAVAANYVASAVHARGADLAELVRASGLRGDELVLDLGTAVGHTALAVAPRARRVVGVDLTAEMLSLAGRLAAERGVTVQCAAWPEVPFRGDEDLLRQLVLNVLQNAVQHTPAGGVVSIDLSQDREWISIRVSDTGRGIPAADRDRIFDRFVQLDLARRGAGTGLGLPIARWIAEAHRGRLALEDSGPQATRFCVRLPPDLMAT